MVELVGRTPIQCLMETLDQKKIYYECEQDDAHTVLQLAFTLPMCAKLAQAQHYIFQADCTYKTNRYKMPLMVIVGVTCTGLTFYAFFVFMQKEDFEGYVWAMQASRKMLMRSPEVIVTDCELALMKAIKFVMPSCQNLLCRWHINKNVLAKCKGAFTVEAVWDAFYKEFKGLAYAKTETEYLAFDDHCTHRGGSLAGGSMICGTVQCPWHGSQFDISSGEVKAGPAREKIATYPVEERDGKVFLTAI